MTDIVKGLVENGVHINYVGRFGLTPAAEEFLPLVANTVEHSQIQREVELLGQQYSYIVRLLDDITDISTKVRRLIGLKAPLYKRIIKGHKNRLWMLSDLQELQNLFL